MNETTTNTTGKAAKSQRTRYVRTEDGQRVLVPGVPTRMDRVVSWIGWHCPELAGVLAPAVLAVTWTPWLWLLTGAVAAVWIAHEVWTAREQAAMKAAVKAGRALPASTTPVDPSEKGGEA
jgi:hypothetical protein